MTTSNNPVRFTTGALLCASLTLIAGGCATRSYNQTTAYPAETGSAPPMVVVGASTSAPIPSSAPGVGTTGATTEAGLGSSSTSIQQGTAAPGLEAERVVIPLHREKLQVTTRDVDAGAVRLRKIVKTETVSQPVTLRREELVIERIGPGQTQAETNNTAGGQFVDLNQPFQEQTITIPLREQQPVVTTEIVQTGQVVAQKNLATTSTTVQHPVRNEDIQIVKIGQPQNLHIAPDLNADVMTGSGQMAPSGNANAGAPAAFQAGTAAASNNGPITSLADLANASDPATFAGRTVQFTDAKVQQIIGNELVALQGPNGETFLVKPQQPLGARIKVGDTVNITGQVETVPSSTEKMGLDQAAMQALQGRPIYIQATTLAPAGAAKQ